MLTFVFLQRRITRFPLSIGIRQCLLWEAVSDNLTAVFVCILKCWYRQGLVLVEIICRTRYIFYKIYSKKRTSVKCHTLLTREPWQQQPSLFSYQISSKLFKISVLEDIVGTRVRSAEEFTALDLTKHEYWAQPKCSLTWLLAWWILDYTKVFRMYVVCLNWLIVKDISPYKLRTASTRCTDQSVLSVVTW